MCLYLPWRVVNPQRLHRQKQHSHLHRQKQHSHLESNTTPAPVTLKLWYLSGSPQEMDVITAQVEKFQEAHPDITVDLSFYGADTYTNTTTLAMNSGTGPDLFYGDIGYVNFGIAFAKNGLIRDLTDIIPAARMGQALWYSTPLAVVLGCSNPRSLLWITLRLHNGGCVLQRIRLQGTGVRTPDDIC